MRVAGQNLFIVSFCEVLRDSRFSINGSLWLAEKILMQTCSIASVSANTLEWRAKIAVPSGSNLYFWCLNFVVLKLSDDDLTEYDFEFYYEVIFWPSLQI